MGSDLRRIYWDITVMRTLLGKDPKDAEQLIAMLEHRDSDGTRFFASLHALSLIIGETAQREPRNGDDVQVALMSLCQPADPKLTYVAFHEIIVTDYFGPLIRRAKSEGLTLANDVAIEIATADWLGVSEYQTYDDANARLVRATRTNFSFSRPFRQQGAFPGTYSSPRATAGSPAVKPNATPNLLLDVSRDKSKRIPRNRTGKP